MKRFAIYCRKSTAQAGEGIERSVEFQRSFCETAVLELEGSVVDVYIDDGVSGALTKSRPAFQRLMSEARRGKFDAVGFYHLDRFGRNSRRTSEALWTLRDAGIEVWDLREKKPIDLGTFEGRVTTTLHSEFAQQYREEIRKKTRDKMHRLASEGKWVQPAPFGYRKAGKHDLSVHTEEASVILNRIAKPFAAGVGIHAIARQLNDAGITGPRGGKWSTSNVRAFLKRPTYRGLFVYGASRVHYDGELEAAGREKVQLATSDDERIEVEKPEWTIIPEDVAQQVDARLEANRKRKDFTSSSGETKSPKKAHGKYLLSGGMLVCPDCGSNFEARFNSKSWSGGRYVCASRRRKPGTCPNRLALPIKKTDEEILKVVEAEILGTRYLNPLLEAVASPTGAELSSHLQSERDRLSTSLDRLVDAVADGTLPKERARKKTLELESALEKVEVQLSEIGSRAPVDVEKLREELETRAAAWKETLRESPALGRLILRKLIGPLHLHTVRDDFKKGMPEWMWEAEAKPAALLEETSGGFQLVDSPRR